MRAILTIVAVYLASCGGPTTAAPSGTSASGLTDEEVAALENCAQTFAHTGPEAGSKNRPVMLFKVAGECLPGCEYDFAKERDQSAVLAMAELAKSCVPDDSDNTSWNLATRISGWISEHRARAGSTHSALLARLDSAMAGKEYALALDSSLPGLFDLAAAGTGIDEPLYIVATESRVSMGTRPVAVFSPDGVTLKELPGGEFPGTEVTLDELPARVASYRKELSAQDIASMVQAEHTAPMLLAAPTLPASRVRDLVKALGAVFLGVANHGFVQAHTPALVYDAGFTGPELRFRSDRVTLSVGGTRAEVNHADGAVDWPAVHAKLAELEPDNLDMLAVVVRSTTTVTDLYEALGRFDPVTGTGVVLVLRDDPAPEPSVSGGEMVIRTDPNTGKRTYGSGKAPANSTSSMPERIVRGYLERQIPKLRACYETALTSQPELAGQVEAEFALDRNGRVSSSTAKGLEPAVDDCVAATIKNVHFPRPSGGGGVLITYWFRFRAD